MSDPLSPTPEPDEQFIGALEQQLREGIRRRARLDPDHRPSSARRRPANVLATAALMLLSLMLGATGTFAVVHQDPAPQRELHLQKAIILLERAQVRLEQRRVDLAERRRLFEEGLADDSASARARQRVAQAESEVRQRELDLRETRRTGRAPVDDLTGPLIDGEDFVTQRLEARRAAVARELEGVEAEARRAELRVQQGLVSERELTSGRTARAEAEAALVRLRERLALRRSFIDGKMTAQEAELRVLLRDAEAEHTVAAARVAAAQRGLRRMTTLYESGVVTSGELREAQIATRDAESGLALAEVQLRMIRPRVEAFEPQE